MQYTQLKTDINLSLKVSGPGPKKCPPLCTFQTAPQEVDVAADVELDYIAKQLEGYSGDDVTNICRDAAMNGMRRIVAGGWKFGCLTVFSQGFLVASCQVQSSGAEGRGYSGQQFEPRMASTLATLCLNFWPESCWRSQEVVRKGGKPGARMNKNHQGLASHNVVEGREPDAECWHKFC